MNKYAGVALWGAALIVVLSLPAEAASKKYCFFEMESMCPGRQPHKGSKIRKPAKPAAKQAPSNVTPPTPVPKPETAETPVPVPKAKPVAVKTDSSDDTTPPTKPANKTAVEAVETQPKPPESDAPKPESKPEISSAPEPPPAIPQPEPKPGPAPDLPALDEKPAANAPPPPEKSADQNTGDQGAACRADLDKLGVTYTQAQGEDLAPCSIDNAVQLSAIKIGDRSVSYNGNPTFNCVFARQFATWTSDVAVPVIEMHEKQNVVALSTGPGFECRNRNGDSEGKISEHASGNAVDFDQITLADKSHVAIAQVANPSDPHVRMLMALRVSGCGYFTTVLGPGSNAAHASHYHFDLGIHGKSGNYRICE